MVQNLSWAVKDIKWNPLEICQSLQILFKGTKAKLGSSAQKKHSRCLGTDSRRCGPHKPVGEPAGPGSGMNLPHILDTDEESTLFYWYIHSSPFLVSTGHGGGAKQWLFLEGTHALWIQKIFRLSVCEVTTATNHTALPWATKLSSSCFWVNPTVWRMCCVSKL